MTFPCKYPNRTELFLNLIGHLVPGYSSSNTLCAPSGKQCWEVESVSLPLPCLCRACPQRSQQSPSLPDDLIYALAPGKWLAAVWGPLPPPVPVSKLLKNWALFMEKNCPGSTRFEL